MDEPIIFSPDLHSHLVPSLVSIHISCITTPPYVIATFIPPLNAPRMLKWWEERVQEIVDGTRFIIMQLVLNSETGKEDLAGYVSLQMPVTETGPFRGAVEKLLVAPEYRRKGIAKALMEKLEMVAREKGRTLLCLDTVTGSPAEMVYPKLGYTQLGIIPEYGTSPVDGSLHGGTFFYKNLLARPTAS